MNKDVIQKANELGDALISSAEYMAFQAASAAFEGDENASNQMAAYENMRYEFAELSRSESVTALDMLEKQKTIKKEYDKLNENPLIRDFLIARSDFQALLSEVDNVIRYFVTGEEPGGCGSGCSGCKGCS